MKIAKQIIPSLAFLFMLGCSNPADDVPEAKVSAATNAAQPSNPSASTRSYAFGPKDSKIEFVGSKVTGSHDGGFKSFAGELIVVDGKLANSGNKVVIDTTSLWSDNEKLTGHLKSPDFFDATKYPTSTFESTMITHGETNSTITGNLTLHGVTKQISFPATIRVSESMVEVDSEFYINRFDFEMKYPGKADDLIRKEVVLKLKVKAAPGKAEFESLGKASAAAL